MSVMWEKVSVEVLQPAPPAGARFAQTRAAQTERQISQLAAHVQSEWRSNHDHRVSSGIEARMLQSLRQRNGEYDPEDAPKLGGVDVFVNITGLKCRAAESWIKDVLVNAADRPWTIAPTPIPDLPGDLKEQVVEAVKREVLARGYVDEQQIRERIKSLKATAMREVQRLASEACDRHSQKIDDQLTECRWRAVFEQWQSDIVTYPSGVLKGPIVRNRRSLSWNGNQLVPTTEASLIVERVSPLDLYPSPEATTPQDANSIIEHMRMTKTALFECIGLPNFDDDAIRMVIAEYEDGFRDWLSADGARNHGEKKSAFASRSDTIDVLDFWGRVQGSVLQEWGVDVPDPEEQYECNVWLVGNYVIRALLNPHPLGYRPYHVTSFNKLPGQFWGEGIPQMLRDIQRTANASARALIRNMAFASGPIAEMDIDRLHEDEDRPEELAAYRVYWTKHSSGGGGRAINFTEIPSVAPQLMAVFDRFMAMADDFSGVPAYSYGSQAGAMKTMGGFSMQYGNALKGIKNVVQNMDRDGIEPLVTQFWTWNMLYDPDMSIKADAKVVTKGAEGLLQKEASQARSIEMLQTAIPLIQGGFIPPQAGQDIARQWFSQQGFDIDQYFPNSQVDSEIAGAFGQQQQGAGAPGAQTSMQEGTPPPQLDGRQAAAQAAMQGSQMPGP